MNFNDAQIHLFLNHAPVLAYPILAIAMIWGYARKENAVIVFSLYGMVAATLLTAGAYFTGEGAEHVLKAAGEIPRDLIHAHEENGELAMILSAITGAIALFTIPALAQRLGKLGSPAIQGKLRLLVLLLAIALTILLAVAAHQGGLIRHTEIR